MREKKEKSFRNNNLYLQIWVVVMGQAEWNKKEELVAEQALKHLKTYTPLFGAFTTTARSELALILKVQEFCYENMNFMKVFQKIVLLFYKSMLIYIFYIQNNQKVNILCGIMYYTYITFKHFSAFIYTFNLVFYI